MFIEAFGIVIFIFAFFRRININLLLNRLSREEEFLIFWKIKNLISRTYITSFSGLLNLALPLFLPLITICSVYILFIECAERSLTCNIRFFNKVKVEWRWIMIESQSNYGSTNFIKSNCVSKHVFYKIYAELHIVNIVMRYRQIYTCIMLYLLL